MTTPLVAVVVLNWNGWRDTIECLESLRRQAHARCRIIVVDNGSTDGSPEKIKAWADGEIAVTGRHLPALPVKREPIGLVEYDAAQAERGGTPEGEELIDSSAHAKGFVLIRSGENLGFAGGNNLAMRYALAHDPDFIWILNNDTSVLPDTLEKLVDFLTTNLDYVAVTGQTRYYDDPDRTWNCGGQLTWYGTRRYEYVNTPVSAVPQTGSRRITYMTGCAPLFRTRTLRDVGLLPTRFFFGEEDFELSHRLKSMGHAMACRFDALIFHKVGASVDQTPREASLGMAYVYYLNRFINLRGRWPAPIWHLWRMIYFPYIIFLARKGSRTSIDELFRFAVSLLRESSSRSGVDRKTFETILKYGYIPDSRKLNRR